MPNPFYQGIQKVVSSARCSSSFQELWFMPPFKVGMSNPRQTHRSVESPQIGPHPSLGAGHFRLTPSGVPSVLLETCLDGFSADSALPGRPVSDPWRGSAVAS